MDKFKDKYRIPSARAPWWDYGWTGGYFITICCEEHRHVFGQITDGKMTLSPVGQLAHALWYEIPRHARNVRLGAFVVMPNHVHGILILEHNDAGEDVNVSGGDSGGVFCGGSVETRHALSLQIGDVPILLTRFRN